MRFEVRVDVPGAVEIVRAAVGFGWRWGAPDIRRFARVAGWSGPETVGTMRQGALFARTGLDVWADSAMFWGSVRGLAYVRVTVSDCPGPGGDGPAAALARLRTRFVELWGEPAEQGAGAEEGVAWVFPNVVVGLTTSADCVDLLLVNPVEQRYWMDRRHEGARRRAALGGWGRLTADLAVLVDTLPADAHVVLSAAGGRYVQLTTGDGELCAELSRSEFIDPTWRYGADVEQVLRSRGWSAGPESNWSCCISRVAGRTAVSGFVIRAVEALRTLGVAATTDLVADGWIDGEADLDIAVLGIAPHPTARTQRAEFLREHAVSSFDAGPLRVDVPGGLEIAKAAREFDWTWTRADVSAFAERAGWSLRSDEARPRLVPAHTTLRVEQERALFSFDGDRLESVCVTLSDSIESGLYDEGLPVEVREQLTAAFTRAADGFRGDLGTPVHGTLWRTPGPVWMSERLSVGVVAGTDTVDLYLVNPAERDRRLVLEQQQTARRATDREWRQFFDDLTAIVAELPSGGAAVVDAGDRGSVHFSRGPESLRVYLDAEAGAGLNPRVTELMRANGWQRPEVATAVWRHSLPDPVLFRDFRHFVEFALWPLRTRLAPHTLLLVSADGADRPVRTPSIGATER
ncbi:DUF6301 family protein [Nocardia sp. NPDC005978]|uniref:DUF6301 family protein n=1 Tax=Nocardia sp. NPDC005978 TaxID=3156725 RepID=UPI0033A2230C